MTSEERKVRKLLGLDLADDLLDAVKRLKADAFTDDLTGLPNRRALDRESRRRRGCWVTVIDLDGFKAINDTLGHEAGDEVLKHAARRLRAAVRAEDFIARPGGDEFVILSDAIIPDLPARLRTPGRPSVGVSTGTARTLRGADRRMYAAKGRRSR